MEIARNLQICAKTLQFPLECYKYAKKMSVREGRGSGGVMMSMGMTDRVMGRINRPSREPAPLQMCKCCLEIQNLEIMEGERENNCSTTLRINWPVGFHAAVLGIATVPLPQCG